MLSMKTYESIEPKVKAGEEVRVDVIKKDVVKRKIKLAFMSVFVCLGFVALIVLMILASQDKLPSIMGSIGGSPYLGALSGWFVGVTWLLCWVGFPIGWNMNRKERQEAKNQVSVTYVIDEHGYVDERRSTLPARIGAFFMSVFMGCLTMIGSFVIAIALIFKTIKDLKYIKSILEIAEKNSAK